jgi:hypothetical protein
LANHFFCVLPWLFQCPPLHQKTPQKQSKRLKKLPLFSSPPRSTLSELIQNQQVTPLKNGAGDEIRKLNTPAEDQGVVGMKRKKHQQYTITAAG